MTTLKTADEICQLAALLVGGPRDKTHGNPETNLENAATLWNAWLKIRRNHERPLNGRDVAYMQLLLKMARTQSGEYNQDDFVDMAGYAGIAGEMEHFHK